ncbi:MAG: hypothetical protein WC819_03215 [Parcubacteria group bacterium]|jgi:hypothetical protein
MHDHHGNGEMLSDDVIRKVASLVEHIKQEIQSQDHVDQEGERTVIHDAVSGLVVRENLTKDEEKEIESIIAQRLDFDRKNEDGSNVAAGYDADMRSRDGHILTQVVPQYIRDFKEIPIENVSARAEFFEQVRQNLREEHGIINEAQINVILKKIQAERLDDIVKGKGKSFLVQEIVVPEIVREADVEEMKKKMVQARELYAKKKVEYETAWDRVKEFFMQTDHVDPAKDGRNANSLQGEDQKKNDGSVGIFYAEYQKARHAYNEIHSKYITSQGYGEDRRSREVDMMLGESYEGIAVYDAITDARAKKSKGKIFTIVKNFSAQYIKLPRYTKRVLFATLVVAGIIHGMADGHKQEKQINFDTQTIEQRDDRIGGAVHMQEGDVQKLVQEYVEDAKNAQPEKIETQTQGSVANENPYQSGQSFSITVEPKSSIEGSLRNHLDAHPELLEGSDKTPEQMAHRIAQQYAKDLKKKSGGKKVDLDHVQPGTTIDFSFAPQDGGFDNVHIDNITFAKRGQYEKEKGKTISEYDAHETDVTEGASLATDHGNVGDQGEKIKNFDNGTQENLTMSPQAELLKIQEITSDAQKGAEMKKIVFDRIMEIFAPDELQNAPMQERQQFVKRISQANVHDFLAQNDQNEVQKRLRDLIAHTEKTYGHVGAPHTQTKVAHYLFRVALREGLLQDNALEKTV